MRTPVAKVEIESADRQYLPFDENETSLTCVFGCCRLTHSEDILPSVGA